MNVVVSKFTFAIVGFCLFIGLIFLQFFGSFNIYAQEASVDEDNEMHGHMHHMMEEPAMEEDAGICPVMHNQASKEYSYTYEGKTYYFCCPMCIEEFKKDPEKYISKIKEINLEAYQFGFSPDPIVVQKDDIVKISATSRDVTHGISIKEYGINVPVKKGEIKKIEFVADKVGEFDISCSVYCGAGHSTMKGKLIVE